MQQKLWLCKNFYTLGNILTYMSFVKVITLCNCIGKQDTIQVEQMTQGISDTTTYCHAPRSL